jgi:high-affinity iron transporter
VYREGFEIVLFLQNLRLKAGDGAVLEGVALGLVLTLAVGVVTFVLQHKLPYKRMLVATGVLLGFVLLVMVGESIQELQLAGWLPAHSIGVDFPGFVGLWFATFPTVEGLVAQALAAALVIGSYFFAEHVRVRAPKTRARAAQLEALSE